MPFASYFFLSYLLRRTPPSYVYETKATREVKAGNPDADNSSSCLECLGAIAQRLVLQPTSLDSESHARMSLKISEKHKKESK